MDTTKIDVNASSSYKVIIADCDSEIHSLTKMILPSFQFEGKPLTLIDTYNGQETREALDQNPDTAVLFLDIAMEENHSGLNVVEYLRKTLKNHFTRIILRIGQSGEAPEDNVIREYDINDYRVKAELTAQRLSTSLYAALCSYRDMTNYSLALDNFYLLKQTAEIQTDLIHTLGEVIEASFEETSGHLKRVTQHMYDFAKKLGMSDTQAEVVKIASALHDVGKIAIPHEILKKPDKLTFVEMATMKRHAKIGHEILSNSHKLAFQIAAEIALHHHEKYDGTGYPDGLKGENIPLYSRMMAIVDVFDAMTHKRVYNDAFTVEETLDYMESKKGTHFDPELLDLFIAHLRAAS